MPDEEKTIQLNFRDHLGILYAKSFLKIIAILFVLMEFSIGRFPNLFVSLIFLFIVYFSMPTSYRRDEPFKASEAWFRMLVGLFIAATLFLFLSPGTNIFDPVLLTIILAIIVVAIIVGFASYSIPQAWMKLIISIAGVAAIFIALPALYAGKALPDAAPIFFITLAFLATTPKLEKEEGAEKIEINIPGAKFREALHGDSMENFGNGIFLTLILAGGWPIIGWLKGGLQLVLGAVWLVSGFVGYMSGREGRPYIGIIMIGFAVLAYSFQFTGTVGTAIFGNYWTPIYNTLSTTFEPIGKSLDAASRQVNYAMCTITAGPGVCEGILNPPSTSVGSVSSIELTNFEAVNYRSATPEIDPQLPFIGTIQMENQGDFSASSISVRLKDLIAFDPQKASINEPDKAKIEMRNDNCVFDTCLGTEPIENGGACFWPAESPPKDIKILTFKCGSKTDINKWSDQPVKKPNGMDEKEFDSDKKERILKGINNCECRDPRTGHIVLNDISCDLQALCAKMKAARKGGAPPDACICVSEDDNNDYCKPSTGYVNDYCKIEDSACKEGGNLKCEDECSKACNGLSEKGAVKKYQHAGWNLRISFDYSFKYFANASLPVRVMKKQEFLEKLSNHQISLEDVSPAYSGGPVSVGIYVGKQPLRTDDETVGTIYIKNDGQGKIKKDASKIKIFIPNPNAEIVDFRIVSSSFSFRGTSTSGGVSSCVDDSTLASKYPNYFIKSCILTSDVGPESHGTIAFSFRYRLTERALERSTIFVGGLDYTYEAEKNLAFPVASLPQQG